MLNHIPTVVVFTKLMQWQFNKHSTSSYPIMQRQRRKLDVMPHSAVMLNINRITTVVHKEAGL